MSWVTNIILSYSLVEHQDKIDSINDWLLQNEHDKLKRINEYAGGEKFMEMYIYAGGFSHFDVMDFVRYVFSLDWILRESLQIFVKDQEDDRFASLS